jgi:hypothetical protein
MLKIIFCLVLYAGTGSNNSEGDVSSDISDWTAPFVQSDARKDRLNFVYKIGVLINEAG